MPKANNQIAARLRPDTIALLDRISHVRGINRTSILELSIRCYAEKEGISLPSQPDRLTDTRANYSTTAPPEPESS